MTGMAQQEVAREAHPLELDAGATADLDGGHRQGHGDAEPALEHPVEEAVLRVVVVGLVAREPQLPEKIVHQRRHPLELVRGRRRAAPGVGPEIIQTLEPAVDVELRIVERRHQQRALRQVGLGLGAPDPALEPFAMGVVHHRGRF